nr:hypothetical protein [Tanacetum cinerariifolium]
MGYYFYFPPENKIVVTRYVKFLKKNIISQEVSGRAGELKEIQDEDTSPFENTSEIPMEIEEIEEHSLRDLNKPTNYKAAMLDPESNKWLNAINAKMKSMKDNQVSCLVDLPHNVGLSQSTYMDKILKRFRMENSKRGYIPMQERLDLNKTQGASTPKEVKRMQNVPYASAVGCIINPEAELRVDCYCNAGFKTNRDDIKSQTGYLNNIAASEAAMEAVWIRKFIPGLGIVPTINEPIKMFWDNSAAFLIANESGVQKGARHYHRRYHYVRECIELGEINLLKVHTNGNLAYPFTKILSKRKAYSSSFM